MKFLGLVCCALLVLASCSSSYYMKRGAAIYETGRFYKASTKYEKAYNKAKKPEFKSAMAMQVGLCNEQVNKTMEALSWYGKAVRADKEQPDPYLKMAETNIRKGGFDDALSNYNKFIELFPEDERGKDGIYYVELLQKDLQAEGRYQVELQKEFNSRYNDFAPVFYPEDNNIVYLTSTRKKEQKKKGKIDPVTGEQYSHIYVTEYTQEIKTTDKRGNVKIKRFPEPRWLKPQMAADSLLSQRDDGAVSFSQDGSTLYFTSSRPIKGSNSGTRIYKASKAESADKTGKRGWTKLAPSGICGDSVSVGHPALTPDGGRIYFSTDRLSGGMGGKDIWYAELKDGKWGEPQNAGELVNTEKDELYPYVRDNGELYFSSNGHDGFGGLDLYKVRETEDEKVLEHLPAPFNSFADDFGIAFKTEKEEGFLTSSRLNHRDKIYSFVFVPQQLQVRLLALNNATDRPVPDVNITAVCDDGTTNNIITDSVGVAEMPILPQRAYIFTTENARFLKGKKEVSTYRERGDRIYQDTIEMQPIEKPIVIPDIYFDLGKWEVRPDAMERLGSLLVILEDNLNITIELSAHTDMIGNDQANMILSEKRAQSVVDYLISKGVYWDRLVAKGYGETRPRQITEKEAKQNDFLKPGDELTERFVNRLQGQHREDALQLNRRIEFKVLHTDYKPGANSLHNPYQVAQSAEDAKSIGETQLKDLKSVKGKFFTLQLGVFRNVPAVIYNFRVVFTEKTKEGTVRYCTGIYDTREDAVQAASDLKKKGIDCVIKEY